jgi:hypothetical protein
MVRGMSEQANFAPFQYPSAGFWCSFSAPEIYVHIVVYIKIKPCYIYFCALINVRKSPGSDHFYAIAGCICHIRHIHCLRHIHRLRRINDRPKGST